jgi:hypothetical protein
LGIFDFGYFRFKGAGRPLVPDRKTAIQNPKSKITLSRKKQDLTGGHVAKVEFQTLGRLFQGQASPDFGLEFPSQEFLHLPRQAKLPNQILPTQPCREPKALDALVLKDERRRIDLASLK